MPLVSLSRLSRRAAAAKRERRKSGVPGLSSMENLESDGEDHVGRYFVVEPAVFAGCYQPLRVLLGGLF